MGNIKRTAVVGMIASILLTMTACGKRTQVKSSEEETSTAEETDKQLDVPSETEENSEDSSQMTAETGVPSLLSTNPVSLSKSTGIPSSANSTIVTTPSANKSTKTAAGEAYGKYSGNVANGGLVTQVGDWIYYSNGGDGNSLYKVRSDGSGKTKLTSTPASNIQVCGDWIIFTNCGLKKIKTDGTNEQKIEENYIYYYAVISDTIYYYTETLHNNKTLPLCLDWVKADGSSSGTVDNFVCNRVCGMFPVENWLYFYVYTNPPEVIKRVRADTFTEETLVASSASQELNNTGCMAVQDDWVYYGLSCQSSVSRCKPDGSQNALLLKNCRYGYFNTDGSRLYYVCNDDGQLWKAGVDGSNPERITNFALGSLSDVAGINLTDNDVFVCVNSRNGGVLERAMYRINKNTLKQEPVS